MKTMIIKILHQSGLYRETKPAGQAENWRLEKGSYAPESHTWRSLCHIKDPAVTYASIDFGRLPGGGDI